MLSQHPADSCVKQIKANLFHYFHSISTRAPLTKTCGGDDFDEEEWIRQWQEQRYEEKPDQGKHILIIFDTVSQYILFWWKDMKENNTLCWGCWLIWPYSAVKQAQCRMQRAGCILPWREEYYGRLRSEGGWSREQKQHANTLCGVSKYLVQELLVGGDWTSTSFNFGLACPYNESAGVSAKWLMEFPRPRCLFLLDWHDALWYFDDTLNALTIARLYRRTMYNLLYNISKHHQNVLKTFQNTIRPGWASSCETVGSVQKICQSISWLLTWKLR